MSKGEGKTGDTRYFQATGMETYKFCTKSGSNGTECLEDSSCNIDFPPNQKGVPETVEFCKIEIALFERT